MPWFTGAAIIGSSLIGGLTSSSTAGDAADANREANATEKAMYDQTRADNMPALDARNASLQKMRELLGIGGDSSSKGYGSLGGAINPGDVQNEAGYQFGLNQGMNTLNNQLAAKGMRNSGAALKAATQYGTDYATTKYDNAFNREVANRSAQLNPLQSLAGLAQTGASTVAGAGTNYANNVSNNQTALGSVNALATSGIGRSLSDGISQLGGWYTNMNKGTQLSGFNGNALTGYTNAQPWTVGPTLP